MTSATAAANRTLIGTAQATNTAVQVRGISTDDERNRPELPMRKKGARDFTFVEAAEGYVEVLNPASGTTMVWYRADTDWGRSALGTGEEFDAVANAVTHTLQQREVGYARNFDTPVVARAVQAISQIVFPEHNPQDLLDRGLPRIEHGQNVMLLPNGALTLEAALRTAQQYFGTKKNHGLESQLQALTAAYTAEHAYNGEAQYFREAVKEILKMLPEAVIQERYKALTTSLLANERSDIFRHVMGAAALPPTMDQIIKNAPPEGNTAKETFEKLTGAELSPEAEERLNGYLGNIIRDRISYALSRHLLMVDHTPLPQQPAPSAILHAILQDVLQPSGFMISYSPSYHGATAGANALRADTPSLYNEKTFFSDKIIFATAPHPYHQMKADESKEEYVARLLREMEQKLLLAGGKGCVAAIFVEPISGSSLGGVPLPEGYLEGLHALSRKYGPEDGKILLVYDEVMSGMGRTGTFLAYQHPTIGGEHPTPPDIALLSKALSSGAASSAAVAINPAIMADLAKHKVHIEYSCTNQNFGVDAAAAEETIHQIGQRIADGALERQGQNLKNEITRLLGESDVLKGHIGEVRGFGHMLGIELVNNPLEKEQIDPKVKLALVIYDKALLEFGLGILPVEACRNKQDGTLINSDTVFLLPPYTMTALDIKRVSTRLVRVIEEAVAEVKKIDIPKPKEEPLEASELTKVNAAVGSYACPNDNLRITTAEDGRSIQIAFRPDTQKSEEHLRAFRRKLMPASGGYTAKQEGEGWTFQLTAGQVRNVQAYEEARSADLVKLCGAASLVDKGVTLS